MTECRELLFMGLIDSKIFWGSMQSPPGREDLQPLIVTAAYFRTSKTPVKLSHILSIGSSAE